MSLLKPIFAFVYRCFLNYRACYRKQQSERALYRLDDHLLDDIGLVRHEGEIVPLKTSVHYLNFVRSQRSRSRLRHAYFVRRRRYLKGRGTTG